MADDRCNREKLPERRRCETVAFNYAGARYRATLGFYPDGRLGEIFMNAGKPDTALDVHARDAAILASLALQHGVDPAVLAHALTRDAQGRPESGLGIIFDMIGDLVAGGDDAPGDCAAASPDPRRILPMGVPFSDGRRCLGCGLDDLSGRFDAGGDPLAWASRDWCTGCVNGSSRKGGNE